MQRKTRLGAWLAVTPAALPVLWALGGYGGGSIPSEAAGYLPISVSAAAIEYGDSLRVSGEARSIGPGSKVRILFSPHDGGRAQLALATVGPRRRWTALARPLSSGTLAAAPAASGQPAANNASVSIPIVVRHRVSVARLQVARRGVPLVLRGTVRPSATTRIRAERSERGRWLPLGSGRSDRNGRFAIPVGRAVNGQVRLRTDRTGGIAGSDSARVRVQRLRPALASWYGLYGGPLACGGRLGRDQMGVAHKSLKCGTRVTISYRGRTVVVPVIDRGPYVGAREWDLTGAVARRLGFDGVGTVWVSP